MNAGKLLAWFVQAAAWAGAIVLIGLTSSAIRERSGDVVYVINAVFLLFGGVAIGRAVSSRIKRRTGSTL